MNLIKKAFDILDVFLVNGPELSLEEISKLSRINKATSRRIAVMLIQNGCLRQPVKRGKYSLGMRFLDFSGAIKRNNGIIDVAGPILNELSKSMNESIGIALWDGSSAVLCQFFHTSRLLKVVPDEGTKLGMHNSSMGKAILANLTEHEQQRYFSRPLRKYTDNTITDLDNLKQQLSQIKIENVAFDDEEFAIGVRGVAVPLKNRRGEMLGSIGMIGPSARIRPSTLKEWVPLLNNCTAEIARQLDYNPSLKH
ncbi:MAG TPA: IclR family transcriptional regulator [Dehalococcoidales bacterium]|nr:IclR family transcriptional regulator [Dehalococcoidales bacterium]